MYKRQVEHCLGVSAKIKEILELKDTKVVVKSQETTHQRETWLTQVISPLRVSHLKDLAFDLGEKVILISATPGNPATLARSLGIGPDEYHALEMPYTFTEHENPIWVLPVGKMSRAEKDATMPKMAHALRVLAKKHKTQKGFVPTYTYDIATKLQPLLKDDPRFIWQLNAQSKEECLDRHINSPEPTILIGPSYKEGIDLIGHLCEWMAIVKFPYLDLGDPIVRERQKSDGDWYPNQSAIDLTQTLGRGIRSKDCKVETYILDSLFQNFLDWNAKLLPKYVTDRIVIATK